MAIQTPALNAHYLADIIAAAVTAFDDADEFNEMLAQTFESGAGDDDAVGNFPAFDSIDTYATAGVLTRDAGLVLRLSDGTAYQITVVRSK